MKMEKLTKKWVLGIVILLNAALFAPQQAQAKLDVRISFQVFYDNLQPYGRWVNDRQYGNLWIPDVEADFQPYATRGHWVQTAFGNTWVSDYSWGWAPFHYGRWVYDDYYGWAWIPGDEWGPAWVDWREGDGYYGWAPMGPSVRVGISINIPIARWIFVPQRYICHPQVYSYCLPRDRRVVVYNRTTVINNYYTYNNSRYVSGPRNADIQRVTNRPVRVYAINDVDRPGRSSIDRSSVSIYRPSVDRRASAQGPSRQVNGDDYRRDNPRVATDNRGQQRDNSRDNNTDNRRNEGYSRPDRNSSAPSQAPGQVENRNDNRYGRAERPDQNDVNRQQSEDRQRQYDQQRQERDQQRQSADRQVQQQRQERDQQQRQMAERDRQQRDQQRQMTERQQQQREAMQQQRDRAEQQSNNRREMQMQRQQQQERSQREQRTERREQPREQSRGDQGRGGRPQRVG